ncbi:hypothetical protein Tco_0913604 [Tanacetum coccineum]
METQKPLLKDEDGKEVDVHLYRSMIGSLMYLTSSRPDIMFAVCACARYQVNPKVSHLHAVKRIFRYLKGQPKLGLWYPKDLPFDLVAYTDSDYAGASLDRKSTTGGCQFLGCRLISWQCKKQTVVANSTTEAEYVAASSCCGQVLLIQNQLLDYENGDVNRIERVAVWNGIGDNAGNSKLMLSGITYYCWVTTAGRSINLLLLLKVNAARHNLQLLVNVNAATVKVKTVNKEQQLQALVDGKKIIITEATVRWDLLPKDANGVDSTNQKFSFSKYIFESMVKNLDNAVKFLMPKEKDTQVPQSSVPSDPTNVEDVVGNEEPSMKLKELMDFCTKLQQRVLDLENTKTTQAQEITSLKKRVKRLEKKGGSRTHKLKILYRGRKIDDIDVDEDIILENVHDADLFGVNNLDGDEVVVESKVTDKAGEKRNIVEEAVTVTDVITILVTAAIINNVELTLAQTLTELKSARPKTKGVVMQEPNESTPTISLQLPSQFDEEDRLAREKAQQVEEANIAWDDIQEKIDADYQLKPKDLKNKSFANIQELFDKAFKRVNTFVDFRTELVEGTEMEESSKKAEVIEESSSKRAGDELEQENPKKQKVDDDHEAVKMKELMKIIPDKEEVAVDAIPLATKPLSIVDWKIVKEGKINYYQIIRADGSSKRYSAFIQMLKSFDREDLETLWKLVKAKHGYTRPEEGYERVLWGDLKTMFEHHVEDAVWRNLRESKVLVWKLFDSCGVHFVRFQNLHVFMLVEKRYPLTPTTITDMLNKKLQADHWNKMCYQLLKLITKQLKNQSD